MATEDNPEDFTKERAGFKLMIADAMIVNEYREPGAFVWTRRGKLVYAMRSGGHKSRTIYGAIGEDGRGMFRMFARVSPRHVRRFLSALPRKFGMVFLVLDGAPDHKSKLVKKFASENRDRLILCHLPTASPQMNGIENRWGSARRVEDFGRFTTTDERAATVMKFLKGRKHNLNIQQFFKHRR